MRVGKVSKIRKVVISKVMWKTSAGSNGKKGHQIERWDKTFLPSKCQFSIQEIQNNQTTLFL